MFVLILKYVMCQVGIGGTKHRFYTMNTQISGMFCRSEPILVNPFVKFNSYASHSLSVNRSAHAFGVEKKKKKKNSSALDFCEWILVWMCRNFVYRLIIMCLMLLWSIFLSSFFVFICLFFFNYGAKMILKKIVGKMFFFFIL